MAKHITLLLILAVAPLLQSNNLLVDEPFDFEQMKADGARIEATDYSYSFNFQNPKHKYFLIINILDLATTIYALENRDNLYEGNFLLDDKPRPEELLLQKVVVSYALHQLGMFSGQKLTDEWLYFTNAAVTLATINNYRLIQTND